MVQQLGGDHRPRVEVRPLLPEGRPALSSRDSVRHLLFRRWPGRLLLGAVAARLVLALVSASTGPSAVTDLLGVLVGLVLGVTLVWAIWKLAGVARRRLLWRVRRKLIVSYIFIGVVPTLLVVGFFLFAGLLMFFNVSAYLFKRGIDDIVDEATVLARTAAVELQRGGAAGEVLERKLANNVNRYRGLSVAFVPRAAGSAGGATARPPAAARLSMRPPAGETVAVGPWRHDEPPTEVPAWVSVGGFGGLLAYRYPDDPQRQHLVIRAVGFPDERSPRWGVVVDIPVDEQVVGELRDTTGIELRTVTVVADDADAALQEGRETAPAPVVERTAPEGGDRRWAFTSMTIFDYVDWAKGAKGTLLLNIRVSPSDIYDRLSAAQSRVRNISLGELFMLVLAVIAVLFLIIETVAFLMGFALARSITGSIHQLFEGTERVRAGDFSHRIEIGTRDQLGELAGSFNEMTSSIEGLLRQAEEKRRLEEELRIAREIQMSLLPRGGIQLPGLTITALCVPAREVGGDYYDFFPLEDGRLGLLIADVAGKGTSAALYMAELKGLMLSLSKIYTSPRELLVEVNRIISEHLDSRSFITMTYAVVDVAGHVLTYARAGHTPLIYLPASNGGAPRQAQVHTPDGLVLGLRIEGGAARFEQLLTEAHVPLEPGDVAVLFTDGITEAMNPAADFFGDARLLQIVEEHGHLGADELRERILREVEAFQGEAEQHDDMTMILLRMADETPAVPADEPTRPESATTRP